MQVRPNAVLAVVAVAQFMVIGYPRNNSRIRGSAASTIDPAGRR